MESNISKIPIIPRINKKENFSYKNIHNKKSEIKKPVFQPKYDSYNDDDYDSNLFVPKFKKNKPRNN